MIPKKLLSVPSLLSHLLVIPAWVLTFVLVYRPIWMVDLLDMRSGIFTFNLLMVMCITLGVLCASRIPVVSVRRYLHFRWLHYLLWCIAEYAAISLFVALYLTLMYNHLHGTTDAYYFSMLARSATMMGAILIYPYTILTMLFTLMEPKAQTLPEDDLVRFYDAWQQLKLVVSSSAIAYIEAETNYVIIKYIEAERLKDFQLRNSMKAIEPVLQKHGIVRCQRSYFVNPKHVLALRKDKDTGIIAELDTANLIGKNLNTAPLSSIPVSPKYYDNLSKML